MKIEQTVPSRGLAGRRHQCMATGQSGSQLLSTLIQLDLLIGRRLVSQTAFGHATHCMECLCSLQGNTKGKTPLSGPSNVVKLHPAVSRTPSTLGPPRSTPGQPFKPRRPHASTPPGLRFDLPHCLLLQHAEIEINFLLITPVGSSAVRSLSTRMPRALRSATQE